MANANLRALAGNPIRTTDVLAGFDQSITDAAQAARTDTLAEVITTIFANPPGLQTDTIAERLRTLAASLSEAEVDARAEVRFTGNEKTKLGLLDPILTFGLPSGQSGAEFSYSAISGFDPNVGFTTAGQVFLFQTQNITVNAADADTHVTINLDGAIYTPTGINDTGIPLEEFKELTTYVAVGRRLLDCILIGPNDLLEDDVLDVTGSGLPGLNADNYKKIFIDHDTPRVWVGHREIRAAIDAQGTFVAYTNTNYHGVHSGQGPTVPQFANQYYYNRSSHSWFSTFLLNTIYYWSSGSFANIFGSTARWLGEHPDATTAAGLIRNFDTNNIYAYYRSDIAFRTVEVLTNSTYVAAVMGDTHYTYEPISAPSGVSTISGVAAGVGLSGGGTSGVVTLNVDETKADFPIIPLDKGGFGVANSDIAAARTTLGLGTSATLDTGVATGEIPILNTSALLEPSVLAPGGATGQILTRTATGTSWTTSGGGLSLVSHDTSLSGTGTTGSPLRLVGSSNLLTDATTYAGGIIDLQISELQSATDAENGHIVSFEIPSGIPNDSTSISLRVNGQTTRGFYDHSGTQIVGSQLQGTNNWITGQRILTQIFVLGDLGSGGGGGGDITNVTAGVGLSGGGVTGSVTLDIDVAATDFPVITWGKGGLNASVADAAGARAQLGLGTVSTYDFGAAAGDVPVLGTQGYLLDAIIPLTITRDTEVADLAWALINSSLTANTETGITVSTNASRKINFVVTGVDVHTNAQFTGTGMTGDPLGIANSAIAEVNLSVGNTPSDLQVLSWDGTNSRLLWKDDETSSPGSGLSSVSHSNEFTGTGAAANPLTLASSGIATDKVADEAITEPKLGISNNPSANQVLTWTGSTLEWVDQSAGVGDITSVAAGSGLSGGGDSGPVTLNIDATESSFPVIPVVKGGTGGTTAAEARTGIGLATSVTAIGENAGMLTVDYADGSSSSVPLEEGGSFRGEGHAIFQGGDTFVNTANGTRFEFGDYAIVDDILYIYNHGNERTGVQPDNISTQTNFTEIPRVLPNPTGTSTGTITSLGIGDTIYAVGSGVDPLLANLETLTNMNVGSISPSDIFYFRDINVDGKPQAVDWNSSRVSGRRDRRDQRWLADADRRQLQEILH